MANHLLSAAYKGYAFMDGTRLTSSDKSVLTRLADWTRLEKDPYAISVAAISMEQIAEDLSMTEPTVRAALVRLVASGCVRVAIPETPTRARRYELDLSKVTNRLGITLDLIANDLLERGRKPFTPWGQAALPLGGKPLSPRGKATFPVPDLPALPALPEKSGAVAPPPSPDVNRPAAGATTKPRKPRLRPGQTGAAPPGTFDLPHLINRGDRRAG
jgi:hypothetical protein